MQTDGLILDSIFYEVPKLQILQGAYLSVESGSVCVLFGRNGSGKSTLLKVAAGQIRQSGGIVIINGERFHKKSLRRRFSSVAYLPQDSMLPKGMRVERILSNVPNAGLLAEDDLLGTLLSSRVGELSGGERRYLEIQLLLSLERNYVLLDEPFTGVEPRLIDRISKLIAESKARGIGFLITDHYHHYTLPLADDGYLMVEKQCRHLDRGSDLRGQLEEQGYMRVR